MSTHFSHEPPFSVDTTPSASPQTTPGEFRWAVRRRDGVTLVCELRDHGDQGVEVWLLQAGRLLFGRRWGDRATALMSAHRLKSEYILGGGTLRREAVAQK